MLRLNALALAALVLWPAGALPAQTVAPATDTSWASTVRPIHWWEPAAIAGGVGLLMLIDRPVDRFVQDNRHPALNDFAGTIRHIGQPEVFATVPLGLIAVGLAAGKPELARTGGRLALSVLLAGGAAAGGKMLLQRTRPNEPGAQVFSFHRDHGGRSMPSGHTAVAFAMATSLSDDLHSTGASIALYTAAGAVAWSRLNDNKHWFSDVAAGAAVGFYSAKLAGGRWRIFRIRPPAILVSPHQASLVWGTSF